MFTTCLTGLRLRQIAQPAQCLDYNARSVCRRMVANEECILLYASNSSGSWLPAPAFNLLYTVQNHCHAYATNIIVGNAQMPSRRDRTVAFAAVQLLQQLSAAQDVSTWCTAVQKAGHGCLVHASTKHVLPCILSELELCIRAASNALRLVFDSSFSSACAVEQKTRAAGDMVELLTLLSMCIGHVAMQKVPADKDLQELLQVLAGSGEQHPA